MCGWQDNGIIYENYEEKRDGECGLEIHPERRIVTKLVSRTADAYTAYNK